MIPSEPPLASPPLLGAETRLSTIKSACSRPFFMFHCVTRPSVEIEISTSPRSAPWSTHLSCHTGSVCLPDVCPDSTSGFCVSLRASNMQTVPSYMPAASRLGWCAEKAMHVTPHAVEMTLSGCDGFLSVQKRIRPSR